MNIVYFLKLLKKHMVVLLGVPVLLAGLVAYFTRHPDFRYASETKLFTGITTGSSVELDKTLNYFAASTSFDNLINVIKSRQTQQEVAVKLLARHLLLKEPDPKYISDASFRRLHRITPAYVRKLVDDSSKSPVSHNTGEAVTVADSSAQGSRSSGTGSGSSQHSLLPPGLSPEIYVNTAKALTALMNSSDTNFVYRLLNFDDPHYSIQAISTVNVQRIGTSDMVQLKYETDDPGVCQQTLALMIDVCIHNYKNVKANQSDAVVKYFENQLQTAADKLKTAEDKLLEFNKGNNIINYYEQSKAVAMAKETLDADYNNMQIKLAGIEAAITNLEQKLGDQKEIELKSAELLSKKDQLGGLAYKIAAAEAHTGASEVDVRNLAELKSQATKLEEQIRGQVSDFYHVWNSAEGLPVNTLLNDWIDNIIAAENTRAGLRVLGDRISEFQKQYAIYAPAGANVKRIEREISVSEGEYLEILHGLNLARLKLQDNELASNIKTVDPPYYPLSPNKTKRKFLILMGAMAGFFIMLTVILFLEYFDKTLNNPDRASGVLKMRFGGLMPKILRKGENVNLPFIINRLLEITIQNAELSIGDTGVSGSPKTILIISTGSREGKTTVAGNLAHKLMLNGEKVLVLNYSDASLSAEERNHIGFTEVPPAGSDSNGKTRKPSIPVFRLLLGYPDNRIAYDSPFLADPLSYLSASEYIGYNLGDKFRSAASYKDLLPLDSINQGEQPGWVIIELPPVLYHPAPAPLVMNSDLLMLVCRSNREWSAADDGAMSHIKKLAGEKLMFFLNGAGLPAVEQILGDLPKKRSWFRKKIKKLVRFQFFSDSQI